METRNPFPIAHYDGPEHFCDRIKETKELIGNIVNGRNTVLLSPRRIGKSVLVEHVFHHLKKKRWHCIYVDIAHTTSLNSFTSAIGSAVLNALPHKKPVWNQFMDFIKGFRPGVSANPMTGEFKAELYSASQNEEKQTIMSILNWLDKHEKVVVALDEFQTIVKYPESGIEAWLRGHIQQMKNTRFIFAGSHQQLLSNMFNAPQRPFYSSASQMKLGKIDRKEYKRFINETFKESRKRISDEAVDFILDWTNVHTYYVQSVCNKVFESRNGRISLSSVYEAIHSIIQEKRDSYYVLRDLMTMYQFKVLVGVAKSSTLYGPTAAAFIRKNDLRSGAAVLKALRYLVDADLLYADYDENGKLYYSMSDIFFMRWLQENYK
jgi:uncharacterized protein